MVRWRFLQVAKKLPITFFASAGTAERKQPPACRSGCRLPITPPLRGGGVKLATFWQPSGNGHRVANLQIGNFLATGNRVS